MEEPKGREAKIHGDLVTMRVEEWRRITDELARLRTAEAQAEQCQPDGWFPFGSHAPYPWVGAMEFSDEIDEAGMPLWERPVQYEKGES